MGAEPPVTVTADLTPGTRWADSLLEDAAVKWTHGGEPSGPAEEEAFAAFAAGERRALGNRADQERADEAWRAAGGAAVPPDENGEPF